MPKTILNKKIFGLAVDERTKNFNEDWFDKTVLPQFASDKSGGNLPVVHVGHTDVDGDSTERPRVAFMDNLRRVGKEVFVDLTEIPDKFAQIFEDKLFPNISVEMRVDNKGFHSLALLGGTEPHFKFDQTMQLVERQFKALPPQKGKPTVIKFDAAEMSLADAIEVKEVEDKAWQVDSALWSKLYDIKNSETMTAEEKKTAIEAALQEYVGLAAQIQKDIVDITEGEPAVVSTPEAVAAAEQFRAKRLEIEKQFAAREAALVERENAQIDKDLALAGFAEPVRKNFLALRKHLNGESKSIQFKAGDKTEQVTPRDAFERFLYDLAKRNKNGTLLAATTPVGGDLDDVTRTHFSAEQLNDAENKAVEKFQAEHKIKSFGEARKMWRLTDEGRKFRATREKAA